MHISPSVAVLPRVLIEDLLARYGQLPPDVSAHFPSARVLGRVSTVRRHGRMAFVDLVEGGCRLQLGFRNGSLPEEVAVGAWLEAEGEIFPSRAGELTLWPSRAQVAQLPTRPLETLPELGVAAEQRLLLDPQQLLQARARTRLIRALREQLWEGRFEEVETPILHRSACGAAARPFTTYSRAMERELSLRVAPEPHLIRLMSAGFSRIFEIARAFRNEGVSPRHQPEFTLMEVYEAGASMEQSMAHAAQLICGAMRAAGTDPEAARFGEWTLDWTSPRVSSLRELVEEQTGCASPEECQQWLLERELRVPDAPLEAWSAVFEHGVEGQLIQPTFVTEWPTSISPLAFSGDGQWARRFELYAAGMELANGFEQNRDEAEQRRRFAQQALRAGQEDVMAADEDYLFAMGWGLPPIGGFGIGIDRLVMLAVDARSIREAVLFPL